MDEKTFMDLIDRQHKTRVGILTNPTKKRVGGTTDRLNQFKRIAAMRNCTTESAAIDLATKQFTDFLDMASGVHPDSENLDYFHELGADIQNYIDLTLAIAQEKYIPKQDEEPRPMPLRTTSEATEGGRNVFKERLG